MELSLEACLLCLGAWSVFSGMPCPAVQASPARRAARTVQGLEAHVERLFLLIVLEETTGGWEAAGPGTAASALGAHGRWPFQGGDLREPEGQRWRQQQAELAQGLAFLAMLFTLAFLVGEE